MKLPAAYPVDGAAAMRWLAGKESESDRDLLDATVDRSPWLYIARMHSRKDWPMLVATAHALGATKLVFRSRCKGIIRMSEKVGALVTALESGGSFRILVDGESFGRLERRLQKIYATS